MPESPLIAIVDDDEAIRVSLDGLVRSLGYRVETFGSAEDFLGSTALAGSVCVISDVQMPGMDGFELAEAIGAVERPVPVILISAFVDERAQARAKRAGAWCFLKKPFSGASMIDCIDRALAA